MTPQNSLPPAGVPDSGNAKYAILALVMVVGAGGLFAWRNASNKPVAAPLPSALLMPPTAPTENPKLDDMPPPPPPAEPDAPPVKQTVRYVGASALAGCDGKCTGTASTELEQAIQVRASQARRCYNQALSTDSSLKGHVSIAVRVGPTGNLCSSNVASNDMGSAVVANCAANMFRAAQGYPSPHGGCVDVKVPLGVLSRAGEA